MSDRSTYLGAKSDLEEELAMCKNCKAAGEIKSTLNEVNKALAAWPIDIPSIRELKIRHADLRGRAVRVKGRISTSTYYNCKFRSQNQWRSFVLSDSIAGGVHVYCTRGDVGCEQIFDRLAGGGSEPGTAIVEYPTSNSVCEEDQAIITGWSR